MMSNPVVSKHTHEVDAGTVRARLHRVDDMYRIRMGDGIGWMPDVWKKKADALKKLLAIQSYGPDEVAACRRMGRSSP